MPKLRVIGGPSAGREINVDSDMTIGRDTGEVALGDSEVSGRHARLIVRGETLVVEDLNSSNGTFVNGVRTAGATTLKPGDQIRVGSSVLEVVPEAVPGGTVISSAPAPYPVSQPQPQVPAAPGYAPAPAAGYGPPPAYGQTPSPGYGPPTSPMAPAAGPGWGTPPPRKSKTPIIIAAVVAGVIVLALIAFFLLGGSGPDKDEFIAQADDICQTQIDKLNDLNGADPVAFINGMVELTDDQISGLKALDLPDEDRAVLDDYIASLERSRELTQSAVAPAQNGDQEALNAVIADSQEVAAESDSLAREYGFETCGRIALTN